MALTPEQIAALLGQGGTAKGSSWKATVRALLKNPKLLQTLQTSATAQSEPYSKYDPAESYFGAGDTTKINAVKQRWEMFGDKYKPFVDTYASMLAETGGGPAFTKWRNELQDNADTAAQQFGLDPTDMSTIASSLDTDKLAFLNEHGRVQRANMKSYYKMRQQYGGNQAEALKAQTGLSGLENVAATTEDFINKNLKESLASRFGEKETARLLAKYKGSIQKKLKNFNPLAAGLAEVVKNKVQGE